MKALKLILIMLPLFSFSQGIVTDWQRSAGGFLSDGGTLYGSYTTGGDDKSVVIVCRSSSGIGGDKSVARCNDALAWSDYWCIKIDTMGNKLWDNKYGSLENDVANCIIHTTDNGYLIGGFSVGDIGCDKTQNVHIGDYWIVKIDSMGNKQWDKRYGGPDADNCYQVYQTSDGGFYLVGISQSGIGYQVTDTNHGGYTDIWLVRISPNGTKLWDNMIGSDGAEYAYSGMVLSDNSIIIVGETECASANGDVSEPNKADTNQTLYQWDGWIIKIDSNGNKVWDKRYGSLDNEVLMGLAVLPDGNLAICGTVGANSGLPDVTDTVSKGYDDVWLLKCDSLGNKLWDKRFGGDSIDGAKQIIYSQTGKLLMACVSMSDSIGDKTEQQYGSFDMWVICADTAGNLLWDKTYGGSDTLTDEYVCSLVDLGNDHYVIATYSHSPVSGNKTVAPWDTLPGAGDMWVVGFHWDSTATGYEAAQMFPVNVYPNPASSVINVSMPNPVINSTFTISDVMGRVVMQKAFKECGERIQFDISSLTSGMYQLFFTSAQKRSVVKFIKQ